MTVSQKKILKPSWTLGQRVEFDDFLLRSNEEEWPEGDETSLRRRRSVRVFNRWHRHTFGEPRTGVLVRLTRRVDTEVIADYYDAHRKVGAHVKTHQVALVAVSLHQDLVVVPLDSLRPVDVD